MGGADGVQSGCGGLINDGLFVGAESARPADAFGGGRGGLSLSAEDNFGIFFSEDGARVLSILSEPMVFARACEDSFNSGGGSMADEDVARAWRNTDTELRSKGICGVEECCTLAYTFFSAPKIADDSAA